MDLMIPIGKGSTWNDMELRFTLRSFCNYYPNHDRLIIVGDNPSWLKNHYYIKASDRSGQENKELNIKNKILKACETDISENFVFANDDHFLTKPIESFKYLYGVSLQESIKSRRSQDSYYFTLNNTIKAMELRGLKTLNFDIHYPIIYNKKEFPKVMEAYDWSKPFGYCIKSLYSNTLKVRPKKEEDLKINSRMDCLQLESTIGNKSFFSIGDKAISPDLMTFLKYLYPNKSKYES